jgi:hypothetical protein
MRKKSSQFCAHSARSSSPTSAIVPARRNLAGTIVTTEQTPSRRAFNVREFCAEYGIGHDNAYKAIREGKLVARKYGKRTIITAEDADKIHRLSAAARAASSLSEGV